LSVVDGVVGQKGNMHPEGSRERQWGKPVMTVIFVNSDRNIAQIAPPEAKLSKYLPRGQARSERRYEAIL
jgi:hypothetical protein